MYSAFWLHGWYFRHVILHSVWFDFQSFSKKNKVKKTTNGSDQTNGRFAKSNEPNRIFFPRICRGRCLAMAVEQRKHTQNMKINDNIGLMQYQLIGNWLKLELALWDLELFDVFIFIPNARDKGEIAECHVPNVNNNGKAHSRWKILNGNQQDKNVSKFFLIHLGVVNQPQPTTAHRRSSSNERNSRPKDEWRNVNADEHEWSEWVSLIMQHAINPNKRSESIPSWTTLKRWIIIVTWLFDARRMSKAIKNRWKGTATIEWFIMLAPPHLRIHTRRWSVCWCCLSNKYYIFLALLVVSVSAYKHCWQLTLTVSVIREFSICITKEKKQESFNDNSFDSVINNRLIFLQIVAVILLIAVLINCHGEKASNLRQTTQQTGEKQQEKNHKCEWYTTRVV